MRDYSIKRKLVLMNMLVSGGAVLLACIVFGLFELNSLKIAMVRALSSQAQIIAANSSAALLYNEPKSAEITLSALKAAPGILAAGVYTPKGEAFALYWRDGGKRALP